MIDIKPFCYYTDFDPSKRRYASEPQAIIEVGLELTDPDLILEMWKPLYRLEDIQIIDNEVKEFIDDVAQQIPEKPDYWSSCGQCDCNIDRAEEIKAKFQEGKKEFV